MAGGTLYWIQHLLFPERLVPSVSQLTSNSPSLSLAHNISTLPPNLASIYASLPPRNTVPLLTEENASSLHALLAHLDPEMASRWHWRDSRKILRSLEITKETGLRASDVLRSQDNKRSLPRYVSILLTIGTNI